VLPFLKHQPGPAQLAQVERQGRVRHAEGLGDRAGGQASVSGLNQQAEQGQAVLLGESAQGCDGNAGFHTASSFRCTSK
jgi:hypothetical protein